MAKATTPRLLAHALRAVGHPEHGVAKTSAALLLELDRRGLILLPHEPGPGMLEAAARAMRATGYLPGSPGDRARYKQAVRYRAMVEDERRRLGIADRAARMQR